MTTPKTTVSFPTFVRLNIISKDLTEEKKNNALTVAGKTTAQNTNVEKLSSTNGGLQCNKNLFTKGTISATLQDNDTINFYGRVNLLNNTVRYTNKSAFNGAPQQYLPFSVYQGTELKYCMRSATSKGHTGGSGNIVRSVKWNGFDQQVEHMNYSCVYYGSDRNFLEFEASSSSPKLFRITVIFCKHGAWLDNGIGGIMQLYAVMDGQQVLLQAGTTQSTQFKRARAMQFPPVTFLAKSNGSFTLVNVGRGFRVAYFSWNVVQLPYYESS
ncbi:hypothetical protein BOKEGFJH_00322 [Chlamydia avium]|uniref:Uncharacterized protein n=1 Tax=Chlamydia avium TaxID=1457141 RepID=A0ABN0MRG9_9CHLA|nr:hypothetical protein [Chlamydia avium]EPP36410.1 hypothetical protein CP10743SC13_0659 [Chlamydia psittaci 10_743_SC13]EPP38057.1 hypothetical protein CP10881SC42_0739 [Chlamydia avium]VVT42806.1 hypothetical protein BOKEGFJH_00322 [Chlamydia avium]